MRNTFYNTRCSGFEKQTTNKIESEVNVALDIGGNGIVTQTEGSPQKFCDNLLKSTPMLAVSLFF